MTDNITDLSRYAPGYNQASYGYQQYVVADEPLYAEPDGTLSPETVYELVRRTLDKRAESVEPWHQRRARIYRRWMIQTHNVAPLAAEKIVDRFAKKGIADKICRHLAVPMNPAMDIVQTVCTVYKNGAKRSIAKPQKPEAPAGPPDALGKPTADGEPASPFGKGKAPAKPGEPTEAPGASGEVPPKGESEQSDPAKPKLADPAKEIKEDPAQEAFVALMREAKIPALEQEWNRYGYHLGPVIVIPRVRGEKRKRMTVDTYLPHCYEPALDPADPYGLPAAVCYAVHGGCVIASRAGFQGYKLKGDGKQDIRKEDVIEAPELNDLFESDSPPYALLRFDTPIDPCDWFTARRCQRLEDGTIETVVVSALLSYVRKTQNKKLLSAIGVFDEAAKGQDVGDPEKPIQMPIPEGGTMDVEALDFDTDPTNFVRHLRLLYEQMAESTGIEILRAVDSGEGASTDVDFSHDGLTEVRNQQIAYAVDFDRELSAAMIREAKRSNHELASKLPEDEEFAELFSVDYGQLSRSFADPKQEMEWTDWKIKSGWENVIAVMQKFNPSLQSDAMARDKLFGNLAINAKWNEQVTKRDLGFDQGADKTTAEMLGGLAQKGKNAGSNGDGDGDRGGGFPFGKK